MNAIEITGLRKAYPDFELAGLDLCLPGGCIMGLIGENGAGKSTTIRLILDMIKPDAGSIKLFGRPNSERALKEDIGVVLDEVGFPDCLTAAQANKVLRKAYKNWDEDAFFGYLKKLSIPESKPFGDFSRGMKMKLGIAAALSHNSKLLILDEATSGLDPVVRDEAVLGLHARRGTLRSDLIAHCQRSRKALRLHSFPAPRPPYAMRGEGCAAGRILLRARYSGGTGRDRPRQHDWPPRRALWQ